MPKIIADHPSDKAVVEFHSASYAVPENIGKFNVTIVRHGRMDNTARVRVESFDGSAKHGSDYVPINEQLVFGPYAKEKQVSITIIDDNQWYTTIYHYWRLVMISKIFEYAKII